MGAKNLKKSSNTELLKPTVWAVLFPEKYGIGLPFVFIAAQRKSGSLRMGFGFWQRKQSGGNQ